MTLNAKILITSIVSGLAPLVGLIIMCITSNDIYVIVSLGIMIIATGMQQYYYRIQRKLDKSINATNSVPHD